MDTAAKDSTTIRSEVSRAYARAVTTPGTGCCSAPQPKGLTARSAGYTAGELEALPADAVVNSFGCGNPVAFSEIGEGDVVLDLGSGAGIDLLIAARKVGPTGRVIGVDMTDEMIARARKNIAASGLTNVEVRKGIIEELPVESGSVDWVISNCVINLSPEKDRVFAEIARVLKPGGRLLVSDIVAEDLPEAVRHSASLYASCIGGAISEAKYVEEMKKAGLEGIEIRDRLVYDATMLEGLADADLQQLSSNSCCGQSLDRDQLGALACCLEGKVQSLRFFGRKPA